MLLDFVTFAPKSRQNPLDGPRRVSPHTTPHGLGDRDVIHRIARVACDGNRGGAPADRRCRYARFRAQVPRRRVGVAILGCANRRTPQTKSVAFVHVNPRPSPVSFLHHARCREGRRAETTETAVPVPGLRRGLRAVPRTVPWVQGLGIVRGVHGGKRRFLRRQSNRRRRRGCASFSASCG